MPSREGTHSIHIFSFWFLFTLLNLFTLLCLFYLIYVYCLFNLASLSIVTYPRRYSTGFQSYPVLCLPERGHIRYIFVLFGYIEWKPGRKFRSRIRMDGSAVCTRDTTPRTKTGLSVDPHLCHVWLISLLSI